MAPAITAPPMTPAATPGPHPHPRRRHWAEASVAFAIKVSAIVTAASKLASVFFIRVSLGAGVRRTTSEWQQARCHSSMRHSDCPFFQKTTHTPPRATVRTTIIIAASFQVMSHTSPNANRTKARRPLAGQARLLRKTDLRFVRLS